MDALSDRHKPALGQRQCPTCGAPYTPTGAKYTYRSDAQGSGPMEVEKRLEAVSYFGECPNGHSVRETVAP